MDAAPADRKKQGPYHHGDLRQALVAAALAILTEGRDGDVSLREVARRAGVSHNAPYKHFADRRELLAAVAEDGFIALRRLMVEAGAGATDAAEALRSIGTAYVTFGVENPAHYRLMFGSAAGPGGPPPAGLARAAAEAQAVLGETIRAGAGVGRFAPAADHGAGLETAVLSAWSLVHGLTTLILDGLVGRAATPVDHLALAGEVTRTLLTGLLAPPGQAPAAVLEKARGRSGKS